MRTTTDSGYTLIEVLITLALLGAVAVPLALWLSNIVAHATDVEALDAARLAANRMERLLAANDSIGGQVRIACGLKTYVVATEVRHVQGLREYRISIKRSDDETEIFHLYRCRYLP